MDTAIVKVAAELCRASYDPADPRFVTVDELRFGLVNRDGQNYLVNRGTANVEGWWHDFLAIPVRSPKGYIAHLGFIECSRKVFDAIDYIPPDTIIVGHSLGGAESVVLSEITGLPIITFGCPRVYSRLCVDFPAMNHTRIVNRGDLVTQVPGPLAWHHLCEPTLIGPDNLLDAKYHDIDLYIANLA